jgi:alkanesulfonate monooxygenase SsuD/methylene tetrahydromethanopterin reductase-like flavin-dependent oxidoreductase (luciferase family)
MALFGVSPDDTYPQMEEALRLIGKVWQPDSIDDFHWKGRELTIEPPDPDVPLRVVPRPLQLPHPPLYLACTKDDTVRLAADYGIGALVLGFAGAEEIGRLNDIYRKAIASRTGEQFVSTEVNDHFSALCPTIVLDDGELALRHGARGQRFFAEAISHWYLNGAPINEDTEDEDNIAGLEARREAVKAKLHEADIPYKPNSSNAWDVNHAYGDAQRAIAYVERLQDAGADEIMCLIQMGLVPQEVCMETIRQWGETVIPHFRGR